MAIASLRDPADRSPAVRIALVSDTHTTRGTSEDQPLYKRRFDRVIASVNGTGVDLVLIAGDLTQGGKPEEIADFKAQARGFVAPSLLVAGNHDVGDKRVPGKQGGVTETRVRRYEETLAPSFFVEARPGVRIVGLNTSLLGSGLSSEARQWAFLEKELARPSDIPTLVLMHYPPFLKTPDEPGDPYWNIEPEPRLRLLSLLRQGGVSAVLSGHLHRPLKNHYRGVLLLTTQPVSFGIPRDKQARGWTLVTLSPGGEIETAARDVAD